MAIFSMRRRNWRLPSGLVLGCAILAALPSNPQASTAATDGVLTNLVVFWPAAPSATLEMSGADDRRQLMVEAYYDSGAVRDLTHAARWDVQPSNVVALDHGRLLPVGDGEAVVTVSAESGPSASLKVRVANSAVSAPVNFPNQIVPIFTKGGCNGGGCHGKSSGQNGFKLSLLGFEPAEDFQYLVEEARGRRLFPASPERSLLLIKGTGALPHGGGQRLVPGSDDYNTLARWIGQGMPFGSADDPTVVGIEVFPKERRMRGNDTQQLAVVAHYSNGTVQDVTRGALFEPNDKNMAKTSENGLVSVFEQPGDVAVMIRYQAKVAVFRATIPLGAPVEHLPPVRNFVDEQVFAKLKSLGMPPSDLCDDSTFIRRATLDIAGRLPKPEETREFLADTDPAKRDKLVDRLVDSPDYAEFFAGKWSALLRNKRANPTHARGTFAFYNWIRDSFLENKPYDQFAREVVAASGDIEMNPSVAWYRQVTNPNSMVEDSAQLFLGQRLQCAQCHHHPYEKWSQEDYYTMAAVFSRIGRKRGSIPGEEVIFHQRGQASAQNKKNNQPVKPAALGTRFDQLAPEDDPRIALAEWFSRPENPYFAKSLVNRYWKHFFGRGLVEPEDDLRETNPPSNPELMRALSDEFVRTGYDLKELARTLAKSSSYQLSAIPNEHNKVDKQHYSRYYPKRLQAEPLFDAVNASIGAESHFDGLPAGTPAVSLPDNSFNASSYFLTVFGRPESSSACECERSQDASLAQSLHLLNSKEIVERIAADKGRAASLAQDAARSNEEKVQELYYQVFSRAPDPDEMGVAIGHIKQKLEKADPAKGQTPAMREAYEDIVWALVNTKEFLFNH